jgi:iron(III) transport system substrate-binding protein
MEAGDRPRRTAALHPSGASRVACARLKGRTLQNRRTFVGGLVAGSVAGAALPAFARQASDADVCKLYAAAKAEGTVAWWTSPYPAETAEELRVAFEAKYPGVKVELTRLTAQVVFQRVLQDVQANSRQCDVAHMSDEANFVTLKKMSALAVHVPPDIDKVPPQFRRMDPDDVYQVASLGFVVLGYNPKKATPAPRTWRDLTDPLFKGQVSLGHPAYSGCCATWCVAMHDKYGDAFFTALAANQPKIGRSINDPVADIVSGEREIGHSDVGLILQRKSEGNAIDVRIPGNDGVLVVAPVGVMKAAPHPNAARLFANFFYSREFAAVVAKRHYLPLRTDMASADGMRLDKIKYIQIPLDRQIAEIPDAISRWRQTFGV